MKNWGVIIIDDPMLHHDGWVAVTDVQVDDTKSNEHNHDECVPMVEWQTTSYPNCNSIHEIDLVLSSGKGSSAFPPISNTVTADAATNNNMAPMRRRWLTQHPWQHFKKENNDSLRQKRMETAELSATMGVIKQEDIAFLGQGWFRAAWRMDVDGLEEYDDEEEEYFNRESVVLKTLRYEREFLEEYYEPDDLLFFLFVRNVIQVQRNTLE